MIGVTIGSGSKYWSMANRAVLSMKKHCQNINEFHIVDESWLTNQGVWEPHALKFYFYDILPDVPIFYFDADTLAIRDFKVQYRDNSSFCAVKDKPLPAVKRECERFNIDEQYYFNVGVYLIKPEHEPVLKEAKRIYENEYNYGQGEAFIEQGPMNVAFQRSEFPIQLWPDVYNYIDPGNDIPDDVRIIHSAGGGDLERYERMIKTHGE